MLFLKMLLMRAWMIKNCTKVVLYVFHPVSHLFPRDDEIIFVRRISKGALVTTSVRDVKKTQQRMINMHIYLLMKVNVSHCELSLSFN